MRKMSLFCAALDAGTVFGATSDLPRLASSQFDYKYEMIKLPTDEDQDGGGAADFTGSGTWLTLGTGSDLGTIGIDASSNGKYLMSNQNVGTAGDGWRSMAPSSATGFTVEARLKITDCTGAKGNFAHLQVGTDAPKTAAERKVRDSMILFSRTSRRAKRGTIYVSCRSARQTCSSLFRATRTRRK